MFVTIIFLYCYFIKYFIILYMLLLLLFAISITLQQYRRGEPSVKVLRSSFTAQFFEILHFVAKFICPERRNAKKIFSRLKNQPTTVAFTATV